MKFGGISLGTSDAIYKVKDIIGAESQPIVIVVSALYGVTEQLLQAANYALSADKTYEMIYDIILNHHNTIIEEVIELTKSKKNSIKRRNLS